MRLLAIVSLVLLAACGGHDVGPDGKTVGGRCDGQLAGECNAGSMCMLSAHFPQGYCTEKCTSDATCPIGTACVADSGGVCEVLCATVDKGDCSVFGSGFTCEPLDRVGASGQAPVCRVP